MMLILSPCLATACILSLGFGCGGIDDADISQLLRYSKDKKALQKFPDFDDLKLSSKQLAIAEKYVTDKRDFRSYHLLFAIRNSSKKSYDGLPSEIKMMILVSALAEQKNLNDWGYLDTDRSYDGLAAVALLQLGKGAIKYLRPMLNDATPASLYGSETGTMVNCFTRSGTKRPQSVATFSPTSNGNVPCPKPKFLSRRRCRASINFCRRSA